MSKLRHTAPINRVLVRLKGRKTLVASALARGGTEVFGLSVCGSYTEFFVKRRALKKVKEMLSATEEEYVVCSKGLSVKIKNLLNKKGMITAFVLCFALCVLLSQTVLNVQITGGRQEEITALLTERGVKRFAFSGRIDTEELSDYLVGNLNGVSFVEADMVGTTLFVNVVSELVPAEIVKPATEPIVSRFDAVVERVVVLSGTPAVQSGDPIKAGGTLIYPYTLVGEAECPSEAKGYVYGRVWRQTRLIFLPVTVSRIRTGRTEKTAAVTLFGIGTKLKASEFALYEEETKSERVAGVLPLVVTSSVRYELTDAVQYHIFEQEKDILISNAYNALISELPAGAREVNRYYMIKELDNCTIIDIYLETSERIG